MSYKLLYESQGKIDSYHPDTWLLEWTPTCYLEKMYSFKLLMFLISRCWWPMGERTPSNTILALNTHQLLWVNKTHGHLLIDSGGSEGLHHIMKNFWWSEQEILVTPRIRRYLRLSVKEGYRMIHDCSQRGSRPLCSCTAIIEFAVAVVRFHFLI